MDLKKLPVPTLADTDGRASASFTMTVVAFGIITLWIVFWLVGTAFGLPVPEFNATDAMTYLTPILSLYFFRRWSTEKYCSNDQNNDKIENNGTNSKT